MLESRNSDLVKAFLSDPEDRLVYQPLVSLTSGLVVGYEVLSRLSIRGEPLDAETFFTQAHQEGLARLVDRVVLKTIGEHLANLPRDASHFFVNVDPDSIGDPEIQETLRDLGPGVVIEMTERGNWDASMHRLFFDAWRAQGGGIALDDFGSGYSGLEKLVVMGPDYVKLDHRLIRGSDTSQTQQDIIRAISQLANLLGFQLLAEGVETEAELLTCMDLGVTLGQGYYLGRPAPWQSLSLLSSHIRQRIRTHHQTTLTTAGDHGLALWQGHNALMEQLLAAPDDQARLFHIVQTLYAILNSYSVSCLVAANSGLYPVIGLGHAHRAPILWSESSLAQQVFKSGRIEIVQQASLNPARLGSLNRTLGRPESIAIAALGNPPWGVLGADFEEPYAWSAPRVAVLKTLSHLTTLLFMRPPRLALPWEGEPSKAMDRD